MEMTEPRTPIPPETPETPQAATPPAANEEMADIVKGAELMAALKRGEGQPSGKWEALARTAQKLGGAAEQTPQTPKPYIPKFDTKDGHQLTPAEQVANIQEKQAGVAMPKFDTKDGHKLTPDEQIAEFKTLHSIQ